jgi:hypothetical protein
MPDIQSHTLPGHFHRCSGAVVAGTAPGGLFSGDSGDELVMPDTAVVDAVVSVLKLAAGRASSAASDPDPHVRRLQALAYLAGAVDTALFNEVGHLRKEDVSWSEIAEATGMASKQAASYRFRGA